MIWLSIYLTAISLYDLGTQRVPNWYSMPILVIGLLVRFPGNPEQWIASTVLVLAWVCHWMGAGDAKLWMAMLWALPVDSPSTILPLMFLAFFISGLLQILWRLITKASLIHQPSPAAWRTIPFLLMWWYVH